MSRDPLDRYYTPTWAVLALLRRLNLKPGTHVLEPFAGTGRIAEALREADCRVVTNDLDDGVEADYHDDFRSWYWSISKFPWIITNPPYKTAKGDSLDWVKLCRERSRNTALLLRAAWLEPARSRAEFLATDPPTSLLFLPRVNFDGPSCSSSCPHASVWAIWEEAPSLPPVSFAEQWEKTGQLSFLAG